MIKKQKPIDINSLISGDIILCFNDNEKDIISLAIKKVTGSYYTHAAICLDNYYAAESVNKGVHKLLIKDIIVRYKHVAIFRQPNAWNEDRVKLLNLFVDDIIRNKANYNTTDVLKFIKNNREHNKTVHDKLDKYFEGKLKPDDSKKSKYFCSELVVNCLIKTGFIDPSATIIYKGNTFSPIDIGKDPTFGTFFGYVSLKKDFTIPKDDEFYNVPTFNEIFCPPNTQEKL